jgi:hypothetical protein
MAVGSNSLADAQKKKTDSYDGPTLLGEKQLPLHLRGDGVFFGGQKKGELLGDCWGRKSESSPQYNNFMRMRGGVGGLLEMLE